MTILWTVLCVIFGSISVIILGVVYEKQPTAYMDEIFHFPQAVNYFHGKFFEWDPKITTPPGLYLASIGVLVPASKVLDISFCNIFSFRAINLLFTVGNFYLFFQILLKSHHKDVPQEIILLSALNLATFPLLYFFTFLYYTDCGSVFFILLMYLFYLDQHHWTAAVFGAISILFRQTNIVWVFFVAGQQSIRIINQHLSKVKKENQASYKTKNFQIANFIKSFKLMQIYQKRDSIQTISDILFINAGYVIVGMIFITFIMINKSIALGDKEAHQVCLNVPQIGYFLLFVLFFASPFLLTLSKIHGFLQFCSKHKMIVALALLSGALSVRYLTHVHPYLLADNRHLTFYLWRRLLGRNLFLSLALIPVYIYSGWAMFFEMKHKEFDWKILFMFCIIVSAVPQKLLELRYFIIPYIIFRINMKSKSLLQLMCEFLLYALVNCFTLYLFMEKTFLWENNTMQRFMW